MENNEKKEESVRVIVVTLENVSACWRKLHIHYHKHGICLLFLSNAFTMFHIFASVRVFAHVPDFSDCTK